MSIQQLHDEFEGSFVPEGDPDWDRARASWNLSVDQRPAAVLEAASVTDVQTAVRAAAEHGWRVAPQATGHGSEPLGSLENALLLKTSRLREVAFDPETGIVRAGAGAQAGEVAGAAAEHGRAAPLGFAPTVGVTGLCLSGGVGWLSRTHGLACNNVTGFDAVLASGEAVRADHENNPDLFWALRGGGGRGAVVTAIELETQPLPGVWGGTVMWPAERTASVLERFLDATLSAPESLTLVFRYVSVPDVEGPPPQLRGQRLATIIAVNLGEESESAELVAPLRSDGAIIDTFGPLGPGDLVRVAGDPEGPVPARGTGFLFDDFDTDTISVLSQAVGELPLTVLEIRHLGGALASPPDDPGAISALPERYSFFAGGAAPTPQTVPVVMNALAGLSEQLSAWRSDTVLLSSAPAGTDPAGAFDAASWDRLRSVERTYDPQRLILTNRDA